jgi:hypothetical protein
MYSRLTEKKKEMHFVILIVFSLSLCFSTSVLPDKTLNMYFSFSWLHLHCMIPCPDVSFSLLV